MKQFIVILIAVALFGFALSSCTSSEEQEKPAQSAIDRFTEKKATEIGDKIRTPINKAKMTQQLGDDRRDAMDQAVQQNSGQ